MASTKSQEFSLLCIKLTFWPQGQNRGKLIECPYCKGLMGEFKCDMFRFHIFLIYKWRFWTDVGFILWVPRISRAKFKENLALLLEIPCHVWLILG